MLEHFKVDSRKTDVFWVFAEGSLEFLNFVVSLALFLGVRGLS